MSNGSIYCPLETLKATIAKCTAWQSWQGNAWTESEAAERIYINALPTPENQAVSHTLEELRRYRPYIVLMAGQEGSFSIVKMADGYGFDSSGAAIIEVNEDVPDEIALDHAETKKRFQVSLGNLLRSGDMVFPGLAELAESSGGFDWHRADVVGPVRTEESELSELGDAQRAWVEIHWGSNSR